MLKQYDIWAAGLRKALFVAFIVGATPLAMTLLITLPLELIIYLLPGKIIELSGYYNDIYFISLVVFGPYYLQQLWECMDDKSSK